MSVDSGEKINLVNDESTPCTAAVSKVINLFRDLLSSRARLEKKVIQDKLVEGTGSATSLERDGTPR
jgi:hypothetical protein